VLTGSADVGRLAGGAPLLARLDAEPVTLRGAWVLQLLCEIESRDVQALLPPALHPTLPPVASFAAYRCPESPFGPFALAQARLECRSGLRPRTFALGGVIDNPAAGAALAAGWGFRLAHGQVELRRRYDEVRVQARVGGRCVLELALRKPQGLAPGDVQYVASLNLARTQRGLRLVQVDTEHAVLRAERGTALVEHFDAGAFGEPRLRLSEPIAASFAEADVRLPKLRFLCRPDTLAFEGTEAAA
jgi:hypothetical protein